MPSALSTDRQYANLIALRQDAINRGMDELAHVYGWSAIKRGDEVIEEKFGTQGVKFSQLVSAARKLL